MTRFVITIETDGLRATEETGETPLESAVYSLARCLENYSLTYDQRYVIDANDDDERGTPVGTDETSHDDTTTFAVTITREG